MAGHCGGDSCARLKGESRTNTRENCAEKQKAAEAAFVFWINALRRLVRGGGGSPGRAYRSLLPKVIQEGAEIPTPRDTPWGDGLA